MLTGVLFDAVYTLHVPELMAQLAELPDKLMVFLLPKKNP